MLWTWDVHRKTGEGLGVPAGLQQRFLSSLWQTGAASGDLKLPWPLLWRNCIFLCLHENFTTEHLIFWQRELDLILQFLECPFYHTNSQQQLAVLCSTQNTLTPQSLFSVNYFFSVLQQSWPFSVSHYMFFFQGLFPWKILPPKHKIRKGYKEDGRVLRKQWNYNNIRKERHLCWNQS